MGVFAAELRLGRVVRFAGLFDALRSMSGQSVPRLRGSVEMPSGVSAGGDLSPTV